MDLSGQNKRTILSKRKVNADGSVTTIQRVKRPKTRKVVIASGVGTRNPTMGDVITSELQPLRKSMTQQLQRRGFNTQRMNFREIIATYYNEFVSNKNNPQSQFVPISAYEFRNHFAFRLSTRDSYNGSKIAELHNRARFDSVGGVVDNIVSIFRYAKLKKRAAVLEGIPPSDIMTDEEIIQANTAEKVERDLEAKLMNEKSLKIGTVKNFVIIALVLILIWYVAK